MFDEPYPPNIRKFVERHPGMRPRMPVACPQGWDLPVAQALEELAALAGETGVRVDVIQVKEKLAELRIYAKVHELPDGETQADELYPAPLGSDEAPDSVRARAYKIIKAAEARCSAACQQCGAPGLLRSGAGALRVLCDDHSR